MPIYLIYDVHRFANAVTVTVIWFIKIIWWLSCITLQIYIFNSWIVAKNIMFGRKMYMKITNENFLLCITFNVHVIIMNKCFKSRLHCFLFVIRSVLLYISCPALHTTKTSPDVYEAHSNVTHSVTKHCSHENMHTLSKQGEYWLGWMCTLQASCSKQWTGRHKYFLLYFYWTIQGI